MFHLVGKSDFIQGCFAENEFENGECLDFWNRMYKRLGHDFKT